MNGVKDIARDMISVLSEENADGGWLVGLAHGLLDLPVDLFYLGYDFIDTENRHNNNNDKYRFAELIISGAANSESIEKILSIILDEYFNTLSVEQLKKIIESKLAKLAGGIISKNIILGDIGAILASRLAFKIASGFAVTSVLSLGAMVSRAVYTSRALMTESPAIYWKLRKLGNLDLLYFLVENNMRPFMRALSSLDHSRELFDVIFDDFITLLERS